MKENVSNICDYEFKAVNIREYNLNLIFYANNRFIKIVFNTLSKKIKAKPDKKISEVEKIDIEERYYNFISLRMKDLIDQLNDTQFIPDGIKIKNYTLDKCWFVRDKMSKNRWNIYCEVSGQYDDLR